MLNVQPFGLCGSSTKGARLTYEGVTITAVAPGANTSLSVDRGTLTIAATADAPSGAEIIAAIDAELGREDWRAATGSAGIGSDLGSISASPSDSTDLGGLI